MTRGSSTISPISASVESTDERVAIDSSRAILVCACEVSDLVRWAELKPGNASQMTVEELLHALQVVSLKTTVEWYVHHGIKVTMVFVSIYHV